MTSQTLPRTRKAPPAPSTPKPKVRSEKKPNDRRARGVNEALQKACATMQSLLAQATRDSVKPRYEVAAILHKIHSADATTYGANAMERAAKTLGMSKSAVYGFAEVARRWDRPVFMKLLPDASDQVDPQPTLADRTTTPSVETDDQEPDVPAPSARNRPRPMRAEGNGAAKRPGAPTMSLATRIQEAITLGRALKAPLDALASIPRPKKTSATSELAVAKLDQDFRQVLLELRDLADRLLAADADPNANDKP
jgi:hypothetical protein